MKKVVFILALFLPICASAQDYDVGQRAYESEDYATALKEWRPLAEQGNVKARTNLGVIYMFGMGGNRNDNEAIKWYRLAAEQGNALAQSYLGFMYETGRGGNRNDNEAIKWYRLAAEQGDALAQINLDRMYDKEEPPKWLEGFAVAGILGFVLSALAVMYGRARKAAVPKIESLKKAAIPKMKNLAANGP